VAEFNILEFLNERIGELIREYNAALMNDRSAAGLFDELSRLSVLREETKKIASTKQTLEQRFSIPAAEFTTIETVYRRIDGLAHEVAATPHGDPHRIEIIEDMVRLGILADSVKKKSESSRTH
jgi:hypothetical protein